MLIAPIFRSVSLGLFRAGGTRGDDEVTLDVEARGLAALDRLIRLARARSVDLRPVFRGPIDKSVSLLFQRRFQTEGAWGGKKWTPLRPATLARRPRPGGNRGGILRDTNRLWASLVKPHGPESYRAIERQEYERGTLVPYAIHHQLGWVARQWGGRAFRHPREVRPRPPIPDPLPAPTVFSWAKMISAYIIAQAEASGDSLGAGSLIEQATVPAAAFGTRALPG